MVHSVTRNEYKAAGSTALYDAIGESVTEIEHFVGQNDKVLVTIITDGEENNSKKWSQCKVRNLINSLKEKGWLFTYIGANQDVEKEAERVGVTETLQFQTTIEGTIEMFKRENTARRNWNERVYRGEENLTEGYFDVQEPILNIPAERITPERIDRLKPNQIFVFGSNIYGRHDGGAAKAALHKFGAQYGNGEGPQGHAFAIPTTGCSRNKTADVISRFIRFAGLNPYTQFLVTAIGCGHGGWTADEMAPLFRDAVNVENISLPKEFWNVIL